MKRPAAAVKKSRAPRLGLKRGPWTPEEDELLASYVKREGEGRWRTLPKRAGLPRCGKSCRLRWMNYLRPNVKRGQIAPDEEDLILRLHRLLGNRWSLIAGRIPGRTDNEIKNYWNTHLSKKLVSQGIDPRTHRPLNTGSHSTPSSTTENPKPGPIVAPNPNPPPLDQVHRTNANANMEIARNQQEHFFHSNVAYDNLQGGVGGNVGLGSDYYYQFPDDMFSPFLNSFMEEDIIQQQQQQQHQQGNNNNDNNNNNSNNSHAINTYSNVCTNGSSSNNMNVIPPLEPLIPSLPTFGDEINLWEDIAPSSTTSLGGHDHHYLDLVDHFSKFYN